MESNNSIDRIFKLLLIGDSNVGKTSIIIRYTENKFEASGISTLGVDVKCKFVSFDNIKIKLIIWDTAGQERFRGLAKNYFHGCNGFILVYDITNKKSFDQLKGWMNDAKEKMDEGCKMIVVGNKKDCEDERAIGEDVLKEFGEKNNVATMEVSAKTNEGIDSIFNTMVEELLKTKDVGIVKDEDSDGDKTYNSLDNSRVDNRKSTQKCAC